MPLEPLNDNVVVERLEAASKTEGGIILPDAAKEKPMRGKILAVGPGRLNAAGDKRIALQVKVGNTVLFDRHAGYSGSELEIDGKKVLVMSEASIIGLLGD